MTIAKISVSKSRTVGILGADGRSKFKKIVISAEAKLDDKDDPDKAYQELSEFVELQFAFENTLK